MFDSLITPNILTSPSPHVSIRCDRTRDEFISCTKLDAWLHLLNNMLSPLCLCCACGHKGTRCCLFRGHISMQIFQKISTCIHQMWLVVHSGLNLHMSTLHAQLAHPVHTLVHTIKNHCAHPVPEGREGRYQAGSTRRAQSRPEGSQTRSRGSEGSPRLLVWYI